jgi:hypothetical protein
MSEIAYNCTDLTLPMTDAGFQLLVSEAVNAATFILTGIAQSAAKEMTFNQMRAVNSARCAVTSLGDSFWNFLASAYYAAKQFGKEETVRDFLSDTVYPNVCTCNLDAEKFAETLGGDETTKKVFSACSEKAQKIAANDGAPEAEGFLVTDSGA